MEFGCFLYIPGIDPRPQTQQSHRLPLHHSGSQKVKSQRVKVLNKDYELCYVRKI